MNIKERHLLIQEKMRGCLDELKELQSACPHEHVKKNYRSNTGNYDPSQDEYWVQCHCLDCGKVWNEDQ